MNSRNEIRFPWKAAGGLIADLVFPPRCPVCDRPVRLSGDGICPECEKRIRPITGKTCRKCGRPVRSAQIYCGDCRTRHHAFDYGCAVYPYREISGPVYRMKFAGRAEYADWFGRQIGKRIQSCMDREQIDVLVPVPSSPDRYRERGYNQAELLADSAGKEAGIPVRTDLLRRSRDTAGMRTLSASERHENLKNAFIVHGNDVEFIRIMLIDDIYTTGATIDACAQALVRAGARSVCFAVLAIGEIHDQSETGHSHDQIVHI